MARITTDLAEVDLDLVARALSQDAYWALGRPRVVIERSFRNSNVAAALDDDGATVGFARAVTDTATFAWLCDVWVEPAHRGRGLGKQIVTTLVGHPDLADVYRWMLKTRDAHDLYRGAGFVDLTDPDRWMQLFTSHA